MWLNKHSEISIFSSRKYLVILIVGLLSLAAGAITIVKQRDLVSAAPNTPVVNTTISLDKTGSEPFDLTTWDGSTPSTNGTDQDADNNVVRLQDSVTYKVEVSVNDSSVGDLTATVLLVEKQSWIAIPTGCKTDMADVTNEAVSSISADKTTLFCNLGPAVEGTTKIFFPTSRVIGSDPVSGDVTLNDDRVRARVSAQADMTVNPSNIATDGDTEAIVTANFKVNTTKSLKVSATDPITGDPLYIAPTKTGASPVNRDGSIIEYVVKATYIRGSMIADSPNEAAGDYEADYQIIDVYTDNNANNNTGTASSTGGILYDWDPAYPACELVGDHGPAASISCAQLNAAIDDIGPGATAPDGINDPNIQIDLNNIDVRDPDADANLFEFKIAIWFDKLNDIDTHQDGLPYTNTVTNRVGTLVNPSDTVLSGFNPVSTEDASNNNLLNYNGAGEPIVNEISYPLITSIPGSWVYHLSFTNLFAYATAKYPDQTMAAGETRPYLFNNYDYRQIDGSISQGCNKIDTLVFEYGGLAPPKQTPTPSLYPWNNNQEFNPVLSTFNGAIGTTLTDATDFVSFYYSAAPHIDPVLNPTPTQAEYIEALRTNTCDDDLNGDGQVNIVDTDGIESNPGFDVDWYQDANDVPGGMSAVTLMRQDSYYDAAHTLAIDPTHDRFAIAVNHLITAKLLPTSPYGVDERLPHYASSRRDSGDKIFTPWDHAPISTVDPSADASFSIASGLADRMTLVPASHSVEKYTEPRGLKVVRSGDIVKFVIEPKVFGLWAPTTDSANISDNLPNGTDYVHSSEEFSINNGATWLSRADYDLTSPDVTIVSPSNNGGDDPLVWNFGSVDPGDQLPLIRYDVLVDPTLVSGIFDNTVTISSDLEANNSQAYRLTILPEFGLDVVKSVDKKVYEKNEPFEFDLTYVNLGGENYAGAEFIDILPYIGDDSGTNSGFASDRDPATTYSGTYDLTKITRSNGEIFYATDAPSASLSNDPCHEDNQPLGYVPTSADLCYQFYISAQTSPAKAANSFAAGGSTGSGLTTWTACSSLDPLSCGSLDTNLITAVKFEVPVVDGSGGQTVSIELSPTGNTGGTPNFNNLGEVTSSSTGDIYTNTFGGRVPEISLGVISNDASVTVVAGAISGNVWQDVNGNATNTNSEGEPSLENVVVRLLDGSGSPILDNLGSPVVTTTDIDGNYSFTQLTSGQYQVAVVQPNGGTQTFDLNGPGDNNSGVVNIFGPNNPDTSSGLTNQDYDDLVDATDVNFSYTVLFGDVSTDKQVSPDTYTVGADSPVVYTVDVINNGPNDASGIRIQDAEPTGITFDSWSCAITTPAAGSLTEACSNSSGAGPIDQTVALNSGGVATYTINATVEANQIGQITNTANVTLPASLSQDQNSDVQNSDTAIVNPQQQTATILIDKSLYEGHDAGALCDTASAVDELILVDKTQSLKDITYCFEVTNVGDAYLDSITLLDATLGLDESDMTLLGLSDSLPLAPGDRLVYFHDTSLNTSLDNTASTLATPVTPDGTPTGQTNVTDQDTNAILVYVFDPPFGIKTGTQDGQDVITWEMVWINDSPITANGVIVLDEPPVGTTYNGNLNCFSNGSTVINSCTYIAPDANYDLGHIRVDADISADTGVSDPDQAVNALRISFDVLVDAPDDEGTYENQAELLWDADNDGLNDFTVLSDDPVVLGDTDITAVTISPLAETGSSALYGVFAGLALVISALGLSRHIVKR